MGGTIMQMMDWHKLIANEKLFPSSIRMNNDHDRSEFERDYNKITFSPFFRQLQNKTQLFPIPQSDFIHSRLTHSLEVSSIGKSLGHLVAKYIRTISVNLPANFEIDVANIVGAACLLHDMGNPPFGHAGEDAISSFYLQNSQKLAQYVNTNLIHDLSHFDGNAQTLRFIHTSHDLNLTIATTAATIKYPSIHNMNCIYHGKTSIFSSEIKLLEKAARICHLNRYNEDTYCRHPLAFIVEAADDICYLLLDLEDAHQIRLINYNDAEYLLLQLIESKSKDINFIKNKIKNLAAENKFSQLRSYAINILIGEMVNQFSKHYNEIMTGEYKDLIYNGKLCGLMDVFLLTESNLSRALFNISSFVKNNAYTYKPVLEIELSGYEILNYLLEQFVFAIIDHRIKPSKKVNRLLALLPEKFQANNGSLEEQIKLATDYIASQSDKYALNLYRKLKGIELPEIALLP